MIKEFTIKKIIETILKNPRSIVKVFDRQKYYESVILEKYSKRQLPTIDLLDLFVDFKEVINHYACLDSGASVVDIALLKALMRKFSNPRYLEIGTWRGESVANIAEVASECVTVDLPDNKVKIWGFPNEFIKNGRAFFSKNLKNVKHILHDSQTFKFESLGDGFDVIFIDGDHNYETVKRDTQNAFRLLRKNSSVIVWHDYGVTPETIRYEVFAGILDGCPKDKINNLYHVSNTLCAIYIEGNFRTKNIVFPEIPNKNFSITISTNKFYN